MTITLAWLTADSTVPTSAAVGPAVRAVAPCKNSPTASPGRDHAGG